MAQYEITALPLLEAGDAIHSVSDDLSAVQKKLENILSELPENLDDLRRRMAAGIGAVADMSVYSKALGRALREITEIYAQAERSAFKSGGNVAQEHAAPIAASPPPAVHGTRGAIMFDGLVMPDWLRAAVLKYEQSKPDPAGG